MDCIVRPAGPNLWNVEATDGVVIGTIEKGSDAFLIVPSPSSPLADLDPLPYASVDAAMDGIGAHCQGSCTMADNS